ncbi:hypothetical protein ACGFIX_27940 [Nocardia salmonicida]|uniref:LmrA/YxaF family transcription factor n=1 Tax=Nocardia salmonicida TaxID=53431 RepID=UPI003717B28E
MVSCSGRPSTGSPSARAAAAEVFDDWTNLLASQLLRAGLDESAARSLATTAVCAVEGAAIVSASSRSVRALDEVGSQLTDLVSLRLGGLQ